jgi:ferritin
MPEGKGMLSKKLSDELNLQLNRELYSGYLYLSMAAQFAYDGYAGMSHWMKAQNLEEQTHAQKMFDYIISCGSQVKLTSIGAPKTKWASPLEAFEDALEHEKKVTAWINALVELAKKENDVKTEKFLEWYVKEQVEEEESAGKNVELLKKAGNKKDELKALDQQLEKREFHGSLI